LYCRLVPAVGHSRLVRLQGWLHISGGLVFRAERAAA